MCQSGWLANTTISICGDMDHEVDQWKTKQMCTILLSTHITSCSQLLSDWNELKVSKAIKSYLSVFTRWRLVEWMVFY